MKKLINEFIKQLMMKLNSIKEGFVIYYEEAPTSAKFPFGVVPSISISDLSYGKLCSVDIELYTNEINVSDIEKICDEIRESLDGYNYQNSIMGFHIDFESQILTKQSEMDMTYRRISFIARIF